MGKGRWGGRAEGAVGAAVGERVVGGGGQWREDEATEIGLASTAVGGHLSPSESGGVVGGAPFTCTVEEALASEVRYGEVR